MRRIGILLILIILLTAAFLPFLPGTYDPLCIPVSTAIQLFSGISLVTLIPAAFWLVHTFRNQKDLSDPLVAEKTIRYIRFYFWTLFPVLLIVAVFTTFGLSKLLCSSMIASVILVSGFLFKGIKRLTSNRIPPVCVPSMIFLSPLVLLIMQFLLAEPLTDWSRSRAIDNSHEMIEAIQTYQTRHGKYPATLNAVWKDYYPGITGIEKYHYTYCDSTYQIYFEQPRFLFDNFGIREFVVYSPDDHLMMISHESWHLLLEPDQLKRTQGWYASHPAGKDHWTVFWFD